MIHKSNFSYDCIMSPQFWQYINFDGQIHKGISYEH